MSESQMIEFFIHFDTFVRFLGLFSNIFYFLVLITWKQKQKLDYFHVHHLNFVGLIVRILVVSWAFNFYPTFENQSLNRVLCFVSETLWGTLKHVRAYSILLLAIHRYIAVFKLGLFKNISNSYLYLFGSHFFLLVCAVFNIFCD